MTAIDEIVYVLQEAFSGVGIEETNEGQSLLQNLRSVEGSMWRLAPAFGSGRLFWGDPDVQPWPLGEAPFEETIAWLEDEHGRFVEHVGALRDEDLAEPRPTNWGELRETRWLVSMMAQHDVYHSGEVNHLRSILASSDDWRWG